DGLVDEVRGLVPRGLERGVTARKAIGYAQALAELHGRMPREDAIAETQQLTRTYARRQVGWFRRYADATTIDADDAAERGAELARQAARD
ncbi:MAG TPA: tRNA (adenosine(37)-N6)-dimethylallyltransferase MiaA, partial [Agromyces mariniharenae]|nr:tRNA (adenosine(37)-N6)-dimethylallyltransferase MiaA [Agromyces mariniharenae]